MQLLVGLLVLLLSVETPQGSQLISLQKTLVYGPGVDPKRCCLPVNYFYIQAVDKNGHNVTSINKDKFAVDFESTENISYHSTSFNLGSGLIFYEYQIFSNIHSLTLHVKYIGKALARSPYQLGPVLHENCSCPLRTTSEWLSDFKCPKVENRIMQDLETFKLRGGVNITNLYNRAKMLLHGSFIYYSIVDGQLYSQVFGEHLDFVSTSDRILLSVLNKVALPDMELIVNIGDWPLSKVTKKDPLKRDPFPIFSWCGSKGTWDIVWPTWDIMQSTILGMNSFNFSIPIAQHAFGHPPWEERHAKAYFRGRDSHEVRLDLVRDHHHDTDLFDVGITGWVFFNYDESVYGPKMQKVRFQHFFNYKYIINIDGTVAAYRLPYLLAGGSLVMKQDSPYYEHFYDQLDPWVHYVPLKKDVRDVRERVEWARDHDEQVKQIVENAARFVQKNLLPDHLYCYIVRLLKDYAQLIVGTPTIHPGMGPVEPEVPHNCTSFCKTIKSKTKTRNSEDIQKTLFGSNESVKSNEL